VTKSDTKGKPPYVPLELLEWLEETYPDRCPDETTPERRVWINAGAAKVVRKLRAMYERQREK